MIGGIIEIDRKTGQTSLEAVYAGGDIATGEATVISAMGSGKIAAKSIDEHLKNKLQKETEIASAMPNSKAV